MAFSLRLPLLMVIGILAASIAPCAQLILNEIMSSNGRTLKDENGDSPDWIELFNLGDAPVDLRGYALSDEGDEPFKWVFQQGSIPPKGFLVVYASGKDRQPGAVPPRSPESVAGLKVWLKADAVLTNDASQVRRSGGSVFVKVWKDQSGQNQHAQQSADALQPLWIAAAPELGGRPALRFDGQNDLLRLPAIPAENDFCLIAVVRTPVTHEIDSESNGGVGGVSGQRYLFGAAHGGDANAGAGLSIGTNGVSVYEHGSSYMPALAVYDAPVGARFVVVSVNYNARRPTLAVQGNVARLGLASARARVTAPVEIGSGAYGAFDGHVAEILLFERSLSEEERSGLEEHLANKYGIVFPTPFHTNFAISADGETLTLTRPNGQLADLFPGASIPRDISYGRQPDGAPERFFFREPTPGSPNTTPGSSEFLARPEFSVTGGFYKEAFSLTLSSPNAGATIRYTFDGSEPTETSPVYTAPLTIRSRAGTANSISTIPTGGGWQPPAGEVFKITVVRARAFKTQALPSETVTHSYLVHPANKYTLPVISLATDRANFFDANIGIYVPGATGGNYWQRGDEWERPLHVEFFEADGTLGFAQNAGVKIHGNTSRQFPQKALRIRARFGASRDPIRYQLFLNRPQREFERFILRQSGHDYYLTFFRDALMQGLVEELGVETQAYRPAIVFLNGEYWGIHNVREAEDKYFLAAHGGVDPENVDFLEGYAAASEGDTVHYQAMIDYLSTHDMRLAAHYEHVQTQMEVANYLDYKIPEIFYYRWDIGNHRLWRPRTPDGRWRWVHFDNDVGWGGFWAVQPAWAHHMLAYVTEPNGPWTQYQGNPGGNDHNNPTVTFLLRKLLENPSFKRDFINRFADLLNTTFHPARVTNVINQMAAVITPEMAEHINRWRAPSSVSTWRNHVQYLRDYAVNRPGFARQHLAQKFGLRGTATVSLSVSHTNQGGIRINTLAITAPTNTPWSGIYFKDNPVTFTAEAKPGFKFSRWEGVFGFETNSMTLFLNGDMKLSAFFEPIHVAPPRFASIAFQEGLKVRLQGTGAPGQILVLESSTDLRNWVETKPVNCDENGRFESIEVVDVQARFFRVRSP
ncbi:MAG: CotH kinase family protein [Verrucomicrobiota bacterium]